MESYLIPTNIHYLRLKLRTDRRCVVVLESVTDKPVYYGSLAN